MLREHWNGTTNLLGQFCIEEEVAAGEGEGLKPDIERLKIYSSFCFLSASIRFVGIPFLRASPSLFRVCNA